MLNLTPNVAQVQTSVRWLLSNGGTALAAYAVGKGWVTKDTAAQVLSDPLVYSILVSVGMYVWGMVARTDKNLKVSVADVDPKAVIVTTAAVAEATPNSPNIVSNEQVKVVVK